MSSAQLQTQASPGALRAWLSALRPATLALGVGPVVLGTALAHSDGKAHLPAAVAALVGALLIQIGTNLYNDWSDFERGADTAERLGPARATQRGWLRARQVRNGAFIAFALAATAGLGLVFRGGWPLLLLGLCSIASGIAYTGGPAPLAYTGWGDAFVVLFFGVAAVCGSYYVQALHWSQHALLLSLAVGALATTVLVVNNLRDQHTDRQANKRTLVVRFGERFGRAEYLGLVVVAYLLPLGLALQLQRPSLALPLLSLPLALSQVHAVLNKRGAELNPHLGGSARVALLFTAMLSLGVLL